MKPKKAERAAQAAARLSAQLAVLIWPWDEEDRKTNEMLRLMAATAAAGR